MTRKGDALDPKGLIGEAYRIDGITKAECRSIFLDWALSFPGDGDRRPELEALLKRHGAEHPDHPMTAVMGEGLADIGKPKRRGGWRGRHRTSEQ